MSLPYPFYNYISETIVDGEPASSHSSTIFYDTNLHDFKVSFSTKLTSLYMAFEGTGAETIDFSNLDTSELTDTHDMCRVSTSLKNVNLSNFNTSKVTNMRRMFDTCKLLESIDCSSFNTENVRRMDYMFSGCHAAELIDVSTFNTKNVTNMDYIFSGTTSLKNIDLSLFDLSNISSITWFLRESGISSLDMTWFKPSNPIRFIEPIVDCPNLMTIKFAFDPQLVTFDRLLWSKNPENGTLYYDSRYDYSEIIREFAAWGWESIPM